MSTQSKPRGIRNNNPGNIEKGEPWQGLCPPESMTPEQKQESRFCVFKSSEWGIRAIARILITYQDKHGLRTISELIARWAPPVENVTDVYADHVARRVGVGVGEPIDVTDYRIMRGLVEAIVRHENGPSPSLTLNGEWYEPHVLEKGLLLAGIEVPQKPLTQSRTILGSGAAGVATLAGAAVEAAKEQIPIAVETAGHVAPVWPNIVRWVFVAIAIAGIIAAVYARLDDRKKGRN